MRIREALLQLNEWFFLLNNLKDVLKSIKVSTASDAIRFLDQIYPKSKVSNNNIFCQDFYKNIEHGTGYTLVYQWLMERDVEANNHKIFMTAGARRR